VKSDNSNIASIFADHFIMRLLKTVLQLNILEETLTHIFFQDSLINGELKNKHIFEIEIFVTL